MKKKIVLLLATILCITGCGSSSDSYSYKANSAATSDWGDYAAEEAYAEYDESYAEAPANGSGTSKEVTVNDTSRKLIKNVDLSVETSNLDSMVNNVTNRINSYGGYIEYSYIYNGTESSYSSNRNAQITARVPAVHLDEFLDNVAEESNVVSKNVNVKDVTLQYVDVEARKASLETQYQRLLELMAEAESVEDIIYIEERLSEIEYELDSAERQIRTYDNQVDYSTIVISIDEVKEFTPVEPKSRWQIMTEGFVDSVMSVIEGVLDFLVGLVVAIPYLVLLAIVVLIIVLIIKLCIKSSKKKAMKKQKELQEKIKAQYIASKESENKEDTESSVGEENGDK